MLNKLWSQAQIVQIALTVTMMWKIFEKNWLDLNRIAWRIESKVDVEESGGRWFQWYAFWKACFKWFSNQNFHRLSEALQLQQQGCGGTARRIKSGLWRDWRSFQEKELTIWNNLRHCFVVFITLSVVNCSKHYNNNDEVVVERLGGSNLDWGEKTQDMKQFASLFRCFCYVNCRKLLQTLQSQQ